MSAAKTVEGRPRPESRVKAPQEGRKGERGTSNIEHRTTNGGYPWVTIASSRCAEMPGYPFTAWIEGADWLESGPYSTESQAVLGAKRAFRLRFNVSVLPFQPKRIVTGLWRLGFMRSQKEAA